MEDSISKQNMGPVAGTRDFFPNDQFLLNFIFEGWRKICCQYGCEEYGACPIERASLWTRKNESGSEDIVGEQFIVRDNKDETGSVENILRPEMTPTVVRMVQQIVQSSILPLKWFSIPQCFRNETTARGRGREFFQLNVDFFGGTNVRDEGEIFALIVRLLQQFGLTSDDIVINVSSRKILQTLFEQFGVTDPVKIDLAFHIIDKLAKIPKTEIYSRLENEVGLKTSQVDTIFALLDVKEISDLISFLGSNNEAVNEMENIFKLFDAYGIKQWFSFDISIVRGLSYYTGIVFEGFSKSTVVRRAILGGGRYDNLFKSYGYDAVPAIGFGLGDIVLTEVLKDLGKLPQKTSAIDDIVIPFDDKLYSEAVKIAEQLRRSGKRVHIHASGGRIKNAFSYADRLGATRAVFVAPDEFSRGEVSVKYLNETDPTKKQITVRISDLE